MVAVWLIVGLEYLTHMLKIKESSSGEGVGILVHLAKVRIMRDLIVLDQRPDDVIQEIHIINVIVSIVPRPDRPRDVLSVVFE